METFKFNYKQYQVVVRGIVAEAKVNPMELSSYMGRAGISTWDDIKHNVVCFDTSKQVDKKMGRRRAMLLRILETMRDTGALPPKKKTRDKQVEIKYPEPAPKPTIPTHEEFVVEVRGRLDAMQAVLDQLQASIQELANADPNIKNLVTVNAVSLTGLLKQFDELKSSVEDHLKTHEGSVRVMTGGKPNPVLERQVKRQLVLNKETK